MALKKYVPKKDSGGSAVAGEFVLEDAGVLDFVNPLVPLEGSGPAVGRLLFWALVSRLLS